jgi:hypothetical protein
LLRSFHTWLFVIERRKYRSKWMHPTDLEFKRTHALVTVACIVFGALFLAVALLSSLLGDGFINVFFGG